MHVQTKSAVSKAAPRRGAAGLRLTTPESVRARQLARNYRKPGGAPNVSRGAALKLAKRSVRAMGFKSPKAALIDQLFAPSKAIDWSADGGIGPVVWPSNAHLARMLNMSESTLRGHLRDLARVGLISFLDDPTYRRHGKRDGDGRIIEAYGIDLSPIAMRHDELLAIADASDRAAREMQRLCRRRTSLDKEIRSLLDSALCRAGRDQPSRQDWNHGQARLDVIMSRDVRDIESWSEQVSDLEILYDRLEGLYAKAFSAPDEVLDVSSFHHRGDGIQTPVTTTATTEDSESCSQSGISHARRTSPTGMGDTPSIEAAYGSRAFEEKPGAQAEENKQSLVEVDGSSGLNDKRRDRLPERAKSYARDSSQSPVAIEHGSTQERGTNPLPGNSDTCRKEPGKAQGLSTAAYDADDDVLQLSIGLLREACPAVESAAPGALANWQALRECGIALCATADINPQVFAEASDQLGLDIAIAATAVTVQKAATGTVHNPGAYLRTLTKRGRAGELRIARSLHGLADRNATRQSTGADDDANVHTTRGDAAQDPSPAFPASGSIAFGRWADTVRRRAPKPTPDVNRVAEAFRGFCRRNRIDMTSPNIGRVFESFCGKWKERSWDPQ